MEQKALLQTLAVAERLKDTTRHCYTAGGRHESVAEHCWMMSMMVFLLREEFPGVDMDKVLRMCVIHDLGECFTGDIPTFDKSAENEQTEEQLLAQWVASLPGSAQKEMRSLYEEMAALETVEAKLYKAIDQLEAVIQHNHSDLSTWIEKEYTLNLSYGQDRVAFSPYLTELRRIIREDTLEKIKSAK